MRRFSLFTILALLLAANVRAQSLDAEFRNPTSYDAKPWVFWYWMYGAVSREGLKADLEAMKEIGLGGAYLMPIKSVPETPFITPTAEQLSPQWWTMVKYAMEKSDSLGLKLGMHICDGFALAGGPWITPEQSMQQVVWSDTIVSGATKNIIKLPQPKAFEGYYEDVAAYAYPVKNIQTTATVKPKIKSFLTDKNIANLTERDNGSVKSMNPLWISYEFDEPFTCRSIEVVTPGYTIQANRIKVWASDDGKGYRFVASLEPPRSGWQNYDFDNTHAIPPTTARFFYFSWSPDGTEPGSEDLDAAKWKPEFSIRGLHLSSEPKIGHWQGKTAQVWRVAPTTNDVLLPDEDCLKAEDIIDVSSWVKDGEIDLEKLPAGEWRIVRMGHTATGHTNATGGGGKGLECDKFSREMVQLQFDSWFAEIFRNVGDDLARRVLKVMHIDSWECGSQNWSKTFASEFQKRRGYDLMPYLLVYTGTPIESAEKTEQVMHDIRRTVSELIVDVFYDVMAENAKRYDCRFSAECVAPTMVSDGMEHYKKVDLPMGEFWFRSPTHDKPNDMLDAISGAHIYGKNIVQAEGFTQLRTMWDEHPAMLKSMADRNYAMGINKMSYHVFVHNPRLDRKPGMTLDGIGLYFQRDQTWWSKARAWVDYAKRCQTMLQQGRPVTDVAVFTGEDFPRRAFLPDRLVNSLPGIFGEARVESEDARLANEGQPQRVMPVGVRHSANMADPEKWIDPLRGYAYDSFNRDVLLKARAVDGKMRLESGAEYSVVVLPLPDRLTPNDFTTPEVTAKIAELRAASVRVLSEGAGLPYTEEQFLNIEPDFKANELGRPAADVAWTHRRDGDTEIYFVANQADSPRVLEVSLRSNKKYPELWNPVTGEIFSVDFREEDGRTVIPVQLYQNESVFVVLSSEKSDAPRKPTLTQRYEINSPWTVTLEESEKVLKMQELTDLSKHADPEVRHYSGTIVYETTFTAPKDAKKCYLAFDEVAVMGEVFVNGRACGIVWTAPLETEITAALKKGKNTLRVEVPNTWANHIKGVHEGAIKSADTFTNAPYRIGDAPLPKSGIIGNVTIKY